MVKLTAERKSKGLVEERRPAAAALTFGLPLFVKHHQVQRVVEMLGHLCDVVSRQAVGAVYGFILHIRPIQAILENSEYQRKLFRDSDQAFECFTAPFLLICKYGKNAGVCCYN